MSLEAEYRRFLELRGGVRALNPALRIEHSQNDKIILRIFVHHLERLMRSLHKKLTNRKLPTSMGYRLEAMFHDCEEKILGPSARETGVALLELLCKQGRDELELVLDRVHPIAIFIERIEWLTEFVSTHGGGGKQCFRGLDMFRQPRNMETIIVSDL
jgi:hypothetical protein